MEPQPANSSNNGHEFAQYAILPVGTSRFANPHLQPITIPTPYSLPPMAQKSAGTPFLPGLRSVLPEYYTPVSEPGDAHMDTWEEEREPEERGDREQREQLEGEEWGKSEQRERDERERREWEEREREEWERREREEWERRERVEETPVSAEEERSCGWACWTFRSAVARGGAGAPLSGESRGGEAVESWSPKTVQKPHQDEMDLE